MEWEHLKRDIAEGRDLRQVLQLATHDHWGTDRPPHNRLVEDGRQRQRTFPDEQLLARDAEFDAPIDLSCFQVRADRSENRTGILRGLEKSGNQCLAVGADRVRGGLYARDGPLRQVAVGFPPGVCEARPLVADAEPWGSRKAFGFTLP
jgi:hypothetical protein